MKAIKILIVLSMLLQLNCGARLRPDPIPIDAISANYPAAEFVVAGQRYKGLSVISVSPNQPLEQLDARVQTYFKGRLQIDSRRCKIKKSYIYSKTELVPMGLTGPATQSCVVTFIVTPELPQQIESEEVVHGYRGHLLIKVVQPEDYWLGFTIKTPTKPNLQQQVVVGPNESVRWIAAGCGQTVSKTLTANNLGIIVYDLADAVKPEKQTCIIESALFGSKSIYNSVFVSIYDQQFMPLPRSFLTDHPEKNLVCSSNDPAVTLISVEQQNKIYYRVAHEGCLTFNYNLPGIFRALTVKGRSSILTYNPGLGWSEVK